MAFCVLTTFCVWPTSSKWRSFCQKTKSHLSWLLSMLGQFWLYFWNLYILASFCLDLKQIFDWFSTFSSVILWYFDGAYFDGAYFDGAYFDGAYFDGAYLDGTYLNGVYLDGVYYLDGIYYFNRVYYFDGVYFEGVLRWLLWWLLWWVYFDHLLLIGKQVFLESKNAKHIRIRF